MNISMDANHLPAIKNVKMGSILTEKIPWLMNPPETIIKKGTGCLNSKGTEKYIYIK
jgi:hypothetical protein